MLLLLRVGELLLGWVGRVLLGMRVALVVRLGVVHRRPCGISYDGNVGEPRAEGSSQDASRLEQRTRLTCSFWEERRTHRPRVVAWLMAGTVVVQWRWSRPS